MNKKFIYFTFILIFISSIAISQNISEYPQISIQAEVSEKNVPENRTVKLILTVKIEGNEDKIEQTSIVDPTFQNLEEIGNSASNKVLYENGVRISIKNYEYILKPKAMGMAYIEPVILKYKFVGESSEKRLNTNRLEIKVVEPIIEKKFNILYLIIIIIIFLLLVAGIITFKIIKNRKKIEKKVEIPLEERYTEKLKEIKSAIDKGEYSQFIQDLEKLLINYIREKYNENLNMLDGIEKLKNDGVNENTIAKLKEMKDTSSLVKFAKQSLTIDQINTYLSAVEDILNFNKKE